MKRGICKLCQLERDLQDSHLMPAGIYRRTRSPGAKIPDPVVISEKAMRPTSDQVTDYVFCSGCEQLFDKGGENYVLRLAATKTRFPLLEKLERAPCYTLGKEWRAYAEEDTPTVNRDVIAYFGLSIFWRASVHRWNWRDGRVFSIDLGKKYNEAIRRYLLGEVGFPENVTLIVVACTDKMTQDVFFMPTLNGKTNSYWQYSFGARGMAFMLQVGRALPEFSRIMNCMTPPQRFLWTRDGKDLTMETLGRLRSQHMDYKAKMASSKNGN